MPHIFPSHHPYCFICPLLSLQLLTHNLISLYPKLSFPCYFSSSHLPIHTLLSLYPRQSLPYYFYPSIFSPTLSYPSIRSDLSMLLLILSSSHHTLVFLYSKRSLAYPHSRIPYPKRSLPCHFYPSIFSSTLSYLYIRSDPLCVTFIYSISLCTLSYLSHLFSRSLLSLQFPHLHSLF